MLVIRFRPGGAYPFLGHAAEALTDDVFALDAVFGARHRCATGCWSADRRRRRWRRRRPG